MSQDRPPESKKRQRYSGPERRFAAKDVKRGRWPVPSPEAEAVRNAREEEELKERLQALSVNVERLDKQLDYPKLLRVWQAEALERAVRELGRGVHLSVRRRYARIARPLMAEALGLAERIRSLLPE